MKKNILFFILCLFFSQNSFTQSVPGIPKIIKGIPVNKNVHIPFTGFNNNNSGVESVVITVDFIGNWPDDAKGAFNYAIMIWSETLESDVTIEIEATWADLGDPLILGSAGATNNLFNFDAPGPFYFENVLYPIALANKLKGEDISPSTVDITCSFNSAQSDWYFVSTRSPPPQTTRIS